MKQILKYINDNGIEFRKVNDYYGEKAITIMIKKDIIWVNGFNEEMKWNRELFIYQDRYKKYILKEKIGISSVKTHIKTGRQKELIPVLDSVLSDYKI